MALEWTHSVADLSDRTCVFHSGKVLFARKDGHQKDVGEFTNARQGGPPAKLVKIKARRITENTEDVLNES